MRKIMYFRVAGRDVHLPKLIGAFILFAALLMFVQASANMFDSWDNLKFYDKCISSVDTANSISQQQDDYAYCTDVLYRSTGIVVKGDDLRLTARQFWGGLLSPIASILFWLAGLFVGYIFYRTGDIVLPIEEDIKIVADSEPAKRVLKKKKK